ncbi:MAG: RNA polymerase sigma factor, partial [Planctomycetes bacterium]|nr:RNA polymerase sigma factor [Planctomycetota bacterium]
MNLDAEFAEHAPLLRSLARRLAVDEAAADDLMQEAYVAARSGSPRRIRDLLPWLATVLRIRAARHIRSDRRRRDREQVWAAEPKSADTADIASKLEVGRRLLRHVDELGGDYRDVVFLRYYEGLEPRRIAARLGVPTATIKTRLARALARLRERLDADNPEGRSGWLS